MARSIKTKIQLIQYFIDTRKFGSYLEVGVKDRRTFDNIKCKQKVGIDPILNSNYEKDGVYLYRLDSDTFFKVNKRVFDITFIDGLHLYEQVMVDTINSWNCLNLKGVIVIHDCLPTNAIMSSRQRHGREWTGDVWKAIVWFKKSYPEIKCSVINIDYGCGVIIKSTPKILAVPRGRKGYKDLDFNWLQSNLNLLDIREFKSDDF